MAKFRTQNRPYDDLGNPNSYFSDDSSDDETSKDPVMDLTNDPSIHGSSDGSSNAYASKHPTTVTSYASSDLTAMQSAGSGTHPATAAAYLGASQHLVNQDLVGIGAHLGSISGSYPATLDDNDLGQETTLRAGSKGITHGIIESSEAYNPEQPTKAWLDRNGLDQDWMGGPGPVLHVNGIDTTMVTPPRNRDSAHALHFSNDSTVLRRVRKESTAPHENVNDTMSPHTRKGGFSSDSMMHGATSFGEFTLRNEEKRFRLNEEFTMGPEDAQPCTENEFMAQMGACSRKASENKVAEKGRLRRERLEEEALRRGVLSLQSLDTPTKTSLQDTVAVQSLIEAKSDNASDVIMVDQHRQDFDLDRPNPPNVNAPSDSTSFTNVYDLYNNAEPTQAHKNLRVHTALFDRIWGPLTSPSNDYDHDNTQTGNGSLLYDRNLIPHGVRQDYLANPTAYVSDDEVNAIFNAGTKFDMGYLPGSFHDIATTTAQDNNDNVLLGTTIGDPTEVGMMRDQSRLGGEGEWDFVSHGQDQGARNGDAQMSDSSSEFVLEPLPWPPEITNGTPRTPIKKENCDGSYVDLEEEGSEYADAPALKRKRGGMKHGIGSEKLNKDGQPRKSRAPRAPLRRWDENDLTKALIGIVWACGEAGLQIPFNQAAQLIDDTCTASALQQAILKLHAQMLKERKQLPKIKMHWPKKGGTRSDVVFRDAGKVPRRKPTMRQGGQILIITLKRAYVEADRSALASPYTPGSGPKYPYHSLDPRAMNAWALPPSNPPLPPYRESVFAKRVPTADYLPQGFSRHEDPFQGQAQNHPGHQFMTEKEYYDCSITSKSLNPQNLTADQVLYSKYSRTPFFSQDKKASFSIDTPRKTSGVASHDDSIDSQQDNRMSGIEQGGTLTAMRPPTHGNTQNVARGAYGHNGPSHRQPAINIAEFEQQPPQTPPPNTPSYLPTHGGGPSYSSASHDALVSSPFDFNMSGVEQQQPFQVSAHLFTYGGIQSDDVPEGIHRASGNTQAHPGEVTDGHVPESVLNTWNKTGFLPEDT
jgi:hypothetical protein